MVRTAGLEPTLPFRKQIFLPLRLAPPAPRSCAVRGLDCPFTLDAVGAVSLGAARPVSTPSRCMPGLARDWPASLRLRRSPTLSGSAPDVSVRALQLKSAASTSFATSACRSGRRCGAQHNRFRRQKPQVGLRAARGITSSKTVRSGSSAWTTRSPPCEIAICLAM